MGFQVSQTVASVKVGQLTVPFFVQWNAIAHSFHISNIEFDITFVTRDGERVAISYKGTPGREVSVGDPGIDDVTQIVITSFKFTVDEYIVGVYSKTAKGELKGISLLEPFKTGDVGAKLLNARGEEVGWGFFRLVLSDSGDKLISIQAQSWRVDLWRLFR